MIQLIDVIATVTTEEPVKLGSNDYLSKILYIIKADKNAEDIKVIYEPVKEDNLLFLNNAFRNNNKAVAYLEVKDGDLSTFADKIKYSYFSLVFAGFTLEEFKAVNLGNAGGFVVKYFPTEILVEEILKDTVKVGDDLLTLESTAEIVTKMANLPMFKPIAYFLPNNPVKKFDLQLGVADLWLSKKMSFFADSNPLALIGGFAGDKSIFEPYLKNLIINNVRNKVASAIASGGIPITPAGNIKIQLIADAEINKEKETNVWVKEISNVIRVYKNTKEEYTVDVVMNVTINEVYLKANIINTSEA